MQAIAEMRLQEINSKEDLSLRLGDALDVKASIGLAVIVFLATQSAYLFDKGLSRIEIGIQVCSVVCIIAAAILALVELWPRIYILPEPESPIISERIDELTAHYSSYPDVESNVALALIEDEMGWAKNRIADNQKKNRLKSKILEWSFWFTGIAVILNLATVLLSLNRIV